MTIPSNCFASWDRHTVLRIYVIQPFILTKIAFQMEVECASIMFKSCLYKQLTRVWNGAIMLAVSEQVF